VGVEGIAPFDLKLHLKAFKVVLVVSVPNRNSSDVGTFWPGLS
jgi:hypothetical protein